MPYYAAHVSNRASRARGTCWVWSPPLAEFTDAKREVQRLLAEGDATLGFVVQLDGDRRAIAMVKPESARKIIDHYLELVDGIVSRHGPVRLSASLGAWRAEGRE